LEGLGQAAGLISCEVFDFGAEKAAYLAPKSLIFLDLDDIFLRPFVSSFLARGQQGSLGRQTNLATKGRPYCSKAHPKVLTPPFGKHLIPEGHAQEVSMSRGTGRIERQIKALFVHDPKRIESTADLCRAIYGIEKVEKKHRVAVLRALKSISEKSMPFLTRQVALYERNDDFWFDARAHPLRGRNVAPATSARPPKR
jgi:hypothetical protein